MPSNPHDAVFEPRGVGPLIGVKLRIVANRLRQLLTDSPLKIAATGGLLCVIWYGLYWLFRAVFREFQRSLLESVVATQLIFNLFFGALLLMLTFSNAIIVYGALFSRREATYLLSLPLQPRALVTLKFLESLMVSSWSLILLGLPLMMAMAQSSVEEWYFYPLFMAIFLGFIPIPAALGLWLAWASAFWLKHRLRRIAVWCAVFAGVGTVIAILREARLTERGMNEWLPSFLERMDFLQSSLLPSTWVSRALERIMHKHEYREALGYLATTTANGLFLAWLGIEWVSRRLLPAYGSATTGSDGERRSASNPSSGIAFFYLPRAMRLIAMKDLRAFVRDPMQWSQLAILFGLMILYLVNVPPFHLELASANWAWLVPLLNLCAVAFMLATFTSRFVFPMVSLEGHQFWLLGLLPLPRSHILWAKFAFAMTVTVPIGVGSTLLASSVLQVPTEWLVIHGVVALAICVGLCGVAAGIGARLPSLHELNPARIANGLGGTVSLVASVALVVIMLSGMTWMGVRSHWPVARHALDATGIMMACGVVAVGVGAGLTCMWIGARHLHRIEI